MAEPHNKDTTVKKVNCATAPQGEMGQRYLVSGKGVAMRLWCQKPGPVDKPAVRREYETVGYVISGEAELELERQKIRLMPGDSWLVPANARHHYRILSDFTAIEATAPPARVDGRDRLDEGQRGG